MTKEEIKSMWLLAAQLKSVPEKDPRRGPAEQVLAAMKDKYFTEVMDPANSVEPEKPATEPWRDALAYIGEVFSFLDENDPKGADVRRKVWETVSNTLSMFWQSPLCADARKTFELNSKKPEDDPGKQV